MKTKRTGWPGFCALALAELVGLAVAGLPLAFGQSGMTGEPTPPPEALTIEIIGPGAATVNCEPSIYRVEIGGGTPPYTIAWNPSGNGDQMWCIFRDAGKQTVYCRVIDAGTPRLSTLATMEVDVAERDEVGEPQSVEEYGEPIRGSESVRGDPTGQPITVCVSRNVESNTSLNVSIPFPISVIEAKVGYTHNEKIVLQATYCYSPVIPNSKQATILIQPVYVVITGELMRRNCMGMYDRGGYSGKKLDHLLYDLEIKDVD